PRCLLLLAVAVVPLLGIGILAGGPSASVGLASPSTGPTGQPTPTTDAAGESSGRPSAQPVPSPGQTASPLPLANVPIVPVADFRSPVENVNIDSVRAVLAGTHPRWRSLEMLGADADGILAALGLKRPADPTRLVLASSVTVLERHLAAASRRLAILRASQVPPAG